MHPNNLDKAKYCNIPLWHKAGYTGKGVKIATLESNTGHGADTSDIIKQVAPDAEILYMPHPGLSSQGKKLTWESYNKLKAHYENILDKGVNIVTVSLSGSNNEDIYQLQKDLLFMNDIAMFVAAGNYGDYSMGNYASFPFWISVGNCDLVNGKPKRMRDSSIGKELDICGFGVVRGSLGSYLTGTSYSCPWVVGMIALWFQWFKEQYGRYPTWQESYDFVTMNTEDLEDKGFDIYTGYGLFILPKEIPKIEIKTPIEESPKETPKEELVMSFKDIKHHILEEEIKLAKELGLVGGFPDGTFRPDEMITRAQNAAVTVRLYKKIMEEIKNK